MLITTFSNRNDATDIMKSLLEDRLIACANIIPSITSIYLWKEVIEEEEEVLVFIKTDPSMESKVMKRIKELHPYETPAIYGIPSTSLIYKPYLDWIKEVTSNES